VKLPGLRAGQGLDAADLAGRLQPVAPTGQRPSAALPFSRPSAQTSLFDEPAVAV
jgi:hypothetical protein